MATQFCISLVIVNCISNFAKFLWAGKPVGLAPSLVNLPEHQCASANLQSGQVWA
jgi:hypothetical protein